MGAAWGWAAAGLYPIGPVTPVLGKERAKEAATGVSHHHALLAWKVTVSRFTADKTEDPRG